MSHFQTVLEVSNFGSIFQVSYLYCLNYRLTQSKISIPSCHYVSLYVYHKIRSFQLIDLLLQTVMCTSQVVKVLRSYTFCKTESFLNLNMDLNTFNKKLLIEIKTVNINYLKMAYLFSMRSRLIELWALFCFSFGMVRVMASMKR